MDEKIKTLLERNLEVSENSLRILKKIYSDLLWRRFFGFVKFAAAAGLLVWGYLQFEPYLRPLLDIFQSISQSQNFDFKNLPPEIKKILEQNKQ